MTTDGFGTLTAGLMERGTRRVRDVMAPGHGAAHDHAPLAPHPRDARHHRSPRGELSGGLDRFAGEAPKPLSTAARPATQPFATSNRRAGPSARLMIQPQRPGDYSRVTVTIRGGESETAETQDPALAYQPQTPSAVTYERRSLETIHAEEMARGRTEEDEPIWIDTPTYSGPDRRHRLISPDVERRKSVPPRIKVTLRLEQERYLRLKLAVAETGRTQQDLLTSALDCFFDSLGVDRFKVVGMSFGDAPATRRPV